MATSTFTDTSAELVQPSGTLLIDALIAGSKWGRGGVGTGAAITFAFPQRSTDFDVRPGVPGNYYPHEATRLGEPDLVLGFGAFDSILQAAARTALAAWAAVAQLQFEEVPASSVHAGQLRFSFATQPENEIFDFKFAMFPTDLAISGDVWLLQHNLFSDGWGPGSQNYLTLLHEIGHALGLKHAHDAGINGRLAGWPVTSTTLPVKGTDVLVAHSVQDLVMAHNVLPGLQGPIHVDFAPTTPMRLDIAAMQFLYGPNSNTNSGDTVYRFDAAGRYNQTIWDGGGIDTIQADGPRPVLIRLDPGSWSQVGVPLTYSQRNLISGEMTPRPDLSGANTVYVYDTVTIENATGGSGPDTLIGNALSNRLNGRAGDDLLDGADGIDSAQYAGSYSSYDILRTGSGWRITDKSHAEGQDNLVDVERLVFLDKTIALDVDANGHAGQTGQIIRALFGASHLDDGSLWGAGLQLLDQGLSYEQLVGLAIGTPFFAQLAGTRSNVDFVKLVYKNVVGFEPSAGELARYVDLLETGAYTQVSLAILACQLEANVLSVELVGLLNTGIEYLELGG